MHGQEPRIFRDWSGRLVVTDAEVARRLYDIPWLWSQVAQAVWVACASARVRNVWPDADWTRMPEP